MERNLDIDRLRAVAVVCTIYAHIQALWMWDTWFMDLIPFEKGLIGSIGVFLFFIISGYVISLTLMKKIDSALSGEIKKSQVIKSFFIKRLFRITPSCLLWVTLSYIGLYFIAPEYIKGNTEAALAAIFNVANIYQSLPSALPNNLSFYWSLSIEEQFYLIFPAFLILIKSYHNRVLLLIILFFLVLYAHPLIRSMFQIHGIIAGILLFIIANKFGASRFINQKLQTNKNLMFIVSAVMIICLPTLIPYIRINYGNSGFIFQAIFLFSLVVIACLNRNIIYPFRFMSGVISWIGDRSFVLYISHYPVIMMARQLIISYGDLVGVSYSKENNLIIFVIWLVINVTLAEISYVFFEKPLTKKGRGIAKSIESNDMHSKLSAT